MRLLFLSLLFSASSYADSPPSKDEIVQRLVDADTRRIAALPAYTCTRKYRVENTRYNKRAEMTVRVQTDKGGAKHFEVLSESGPKLVRSLALRRMLEAEEDANRKGEREQTMIWPRNYEFQWVGPGEYLGRPAYILSVEPKTSNRFLIRGRIWVDAEQYAVVKIEGQPAKNPSFWLSNVRVNQSYENIGMFWLPKVNNSSADVRFFGTSTTVIEYSDYKLQ